MMRRLWPWLLIGGAACAGCTARRPSIVTVPHVDLPRFMGDWYVIANIPTFVEKDAYNAVESYRLDADGTIATTFTFRQGGFDGELKRYRPRGFVFDERSNAVWGMQFVWPFKGDFRIVYLDADYTQTVIGREKRDDVWIMARQPTMPEADYQRLVEMLRREGYDFALLAGAPGANLRHYRFMMEGLRDVAEDLDRRGIAFVSRRASHHEFLQLCDEVRLALVVGDENPLRGAERTRQPATERLRVPFWTVDADVIVPSRLSDRLDHAGRHEMVEVIEDYGRGLLPLVAPLTMVRHYVRRFAIAYLQAQTYLEPHPKELMLRNHV